MRVRFALPASADSKPHEDATSMSSRSMCDRIEDATSQFLIDHHKRIIGPEPFSALPWQEKIDRQLLLGAFNKLAESYDTKVQALLGLKVRIDHLRRSAPALKSYKARSLSRLSIDRKAEEVLRELEEKEAEEKVILEDIFDVAKDIVKLGRAD